MGGLLAIQAKTRGVTQLPLFFTENVGHFERGSYAFEPKARSEHCKCLICAREPVVGLGPFSWRSEVR